MYNFSNPLNESFKGNRRHKISPPRSVGWRAGEQRRHQWTPADCKHLNDLQNVSTSTVHRRGAMILSRTIDLIPCLSREVGKDLLRVLQLAVAEKGLERIHLIQCMHWTRPLPR